MKKSIHQIIVSAAEGDAITSMAFALRDQLRDNAESEIFSYWRHGHRMNRECKSLEGLPPASEVSLLVYHASIGHKAVSQTVRDWTGPLALAYHNMTPSHFFRGLNDELADDLDLGREDLEKLRRKSLLTLADSEFNAAELRSIGYDDVHIVPAGFDLSRLQGQTLKSGILDAMKRRYPNGYVVVVGQLLPHKRVEETIAAVHLLNSTHWLGMGLVLCGSPRVAQYEAAIHGFAATCPMVDVHFAGHVSDDELATYMAGSSVLLTMSEHEGMCFPPLEAARMGIPVVAKGSGALPDTVRSSAVLLPSDAGPVLAAEALFAVLTDTDLRARLINAGYARARQVEAQTRESDAARLLIEACA